jgi:hypothetical protein
MIDPALLVAVTGFTHFITGDPKYLTVADMDRAAAIPRKIRRAVKAYVGATDWPGLTLEKVGYDWRKRSKALADYDPSDITTMEKMVDGLPSSEQISGGYIGALQRVVQYVQDKQPHNADIQMTGIRQRDPAPIEIYRWERIVTLAEEPLYVLEWMHEGRLTGAAVDCMTAIYPSILDMMTNEAVQALATMQTNGAWSLPRAKATQLSQLLGSFAAPGLQQAIQAMLDEESAKKPTAKSPPVSSTSAVAKGLRGTSGKEA